ncbi:MAG: helix-turn-helix domain-containing protein [Eubacteriales bacterium]
MSSNILNNIENFYFHRTDNRICSNSTQHYHSGVEIYYMKEGKCHYFINDTSYDIVSGDIIIIPEGMLHGTTYGAKPCTRLLINISRNFIDREIFNAALSLGHLYRNPATLAQINDIFSRIEAEYLRADDLSASGLKCYIETLFMTMIRNQGEKIKHEGNTIVEAAIQYIQNNYMTTIRLADVAKMLSVSEEHLSRLFKKEVAFGFNEYITLKRLQKAEHMLKNEPSRAITEVAYACGFNDSNYFSYKFKKAYGKTPSEVRDAHLVSDAPDSPNHIG